jgi:hypothetical protein
VPQRFEPVTEAKAIVARAVEELEKSGISRDS